MAYDEELAERVRQSFGRLANLTEKKMFGGLCFLVAGNMCVGLVGNSLMVRVGPDGYDEALADPNAREMDFTGRSMNGFVFVAADGLVADSALSRWIDRALAFVGTLPEKAAAAPRKPRSPRPARTGRTKPTPGWPRRPAS